MNAPNDSFDQLQQLIAGDRRCEADCSHFLREARSLLVDHPSNDYLEEAYQYRGNTGISDYIIVCREDDGLGNSSTKAYVWELKAPQCYLFVEDNNNRVCPSDDFVSGENQLLHYFDEYRGWMTFRKRFNLREDDDIRLGGIIIGSRNRLVSGGNYDQATRTRLARTALDVRTRYLYGRSGIKILDWDTIAEYIRPPPIITPPVVAPATGIVQIAGTAPTFVSSGSPN